jgi:phospholipase C
VTNPVTGQVLPNGGADAPTPVQPIPTIMDRLDAAGLPWKIYGAQCTQEIPDAAGTDTCQQSSGAYIWSVCPSFAECLYSQDGGLQPDTQFITDANSGTLPSFSVVTPQDFTDSWHNGADVVTGDNWVGQLVSSVENGPDWSSTAIFITWDDCGCFYDQVPPGVNPDGTPQGPRVPLLIVSPYARPGYTDTTPTTFAGILAYTEQNFGLTPLSVNDTAAYGFGNAFNYGQTPQRPVRMMTRPVPRRDHINWAQAKEDS